MSKTLSDLTNFATSKAESEHYPTPGDRVLKGNPIQHNTLHFQADNCFFAGEWGAGIGCWKVSYTENEYFRILSGKSILRDLNGEELLLSAGDQLCIPAGFEGEWEVIEPTRKIYVIYESPQD